MASNVDSRRMKSCENKIYNGIFRFTKDYQMVFRAVLCHTNTRDVFETFDKRKNTVHEPVDECLFNFAKVEQHPKYLVDKILHGESFTICFFKITN